MNTYAINSLSSRTYVQFTENFSNGQGLSWWSSGQEFAFQCRGHGFDPWMGTKTPHAAGQPSPHASPSLQSPCSATRESPQAATRPSAAKKKRPGSKMSQWGMLKWATVDSYYPANPLRGAPGWQWLHWAKQWALYLVVPLYRERTGSR